MFENLTEKFDRAFKVLKGHGQITEINVAETLKEVRRALLDADVNFKTAKEFTTRVKEKGSRGYQFSRESWYYLDVRSSRIW
jgi:signal recognition particle subunit SRP54